MKIELKEIPIRDLVKDYIDNEEEGVLGYGGRLNIRPKYQREFIYKDAQRDAVIDTVLKGFPLNVMYWAKNSEDSFEILDGQQRTISICKYVNGEFSYNSKYFHNLTQDVKDKLLDYSLMVYFCEGEESEKLEWFKTINIAGEKLTDQELRNAVYSGAWTTDAKRYFSKTGCPAYGVASDYMAGVAIRQEYLETAIKWLAKTEDITIEDYMAKHQNETSAVDLWTYFQSVINWVKNIFPKYRKEQKGIEWGFLYNEYKDIKCDPKQLEERISELMEDEDVTNKKGIYEYILSGDERKLNIRVFSKNDKREAYERQNGICIKCGEHFELEEMNGDHIIPWSKGGKTIPENCQMLCKLCNAKKSDKF